MVPNLESCISFEFREDAVACANGVVCCLEDRWDCLRDAKGEDKEI